MEFLHVSPMLLNVAPEPFDSKDYIFELKLDGIRCLAFCDDKTLLQSRNKKDITQIFPEFESIHAQCKQPCVLDGEIVCLGTDGKPDFQLLLQRIQAKASAKKLAANLPCCFVVFDILLLNNKNICSLPLLKRKQLLQQNVSENNYVMLMRFVSHQGKQFFENTKQLGLEGIVAKKKNSAYYLGQRTSEWLKIKNIIEEDCLVCGYQPDDQNNVKYLVLANWQQNKLVFDQLLYVPPGKKDQKLIKQFAAQNPSEPWFEIENVVWMQPKLVCTLQYLNKTQNKTRRQPVFKGIRFD
jgi:DNA ligase D-like protein (predicted ligase)